VAQSDTIIIAEVGL